VNRQQILAEWQQWGLGLTEAPRVLNELPGGLTNQSYLLQSGLKQWVLRCNAENSVDLGIDRQQENKILTLTARAKLSPFPTYTHTFYDYLVSPCLPQWQCASESLTSAGSDGDIESMANRVKKLHNLEVNDTDISTLNYVQHSQNYLHSINNRIGSLPSDIAQLQQVELPFVELFQNTMRQSVLCHNDLSPPHWRLQGDDLCLIDWEYASLGDAVFDLAVLIDTWQFNDSQIDCLLSCYGGVDRGRFELAQRVNRYISKLWFCLQRL